MWRENPNDTEINKKYYRQCGKYTISKHSGRYALTSRDEDEIIIHGWRDTMKEAQELHEQIQNKT